MSHNRNNDDDDNNNNRNSSNNTEDWTIQRDAFKSLGDTAFRSGHFALAIQHYTQALSVDPDSAVLYSNRSAAYLKDNQKSRALHDAEACVKIGSMGSKGTGRLAAALQALGRWQAALEQWKAVLKEDASNQAAIQGVTDCEKALEAIVKEQSNAKESNDDEEKQEEVEQADELDDFFNEVEEVTVAVKKEKELAAQPVATNAIKNQKKDLGTAEQNIERLLQENYKWKNLNPFHVLQIPHTASKDEINKRYKALSLLLHPDKNTNKDNADRIQLAYDEVQKAKELLDDDDRANHARQLVEQGLLQGQYDWDKRNKNKNSHPDNDDDTLDSCQQRAIFKIFAQVEYSRRDVERRQRAQEQRERQQEEELLQKEREERQFDKSWKQDERVEKRIGSWRDFSKKKKSKL